MSGKPWRIKRLFLNFWWLPSMTWLDPMSTAIKRMLAPHWDAQLDLESSPTFRKFWQLSSFALLVPSFYLLWNNSCFPESWVSHGLCVRFQRLLDCVISLGVTFHPLSQAIRVSILDGKAVQIIVCTPPSEICEKNAILKLFAFLKISQKTRKHALHANLKGWFRTISIIFKVQL